MHETAVVSCFLRHRGAVLLCRQSEEVGSYPGRWGAVAGHTEGDPDADARQEIAEETGLDPAAVTLASRGHPFPVADPSWGTRWTVHPYLFDCPTRDVETNYETAEYEWVSPTAILDRETVPDLWTSYDRVRPGVETVAEDTDHGAAYLSVRALEVLRDGAGLRARAAVTGGDEDGADNAGSPLVVHAEDGWEELADIAVALREARPAMPVVCNRVNRVMAAARHARTATAVEHAAAAGIEAALGADERAAVHAARRVSDARVATLSRSGTVRETLALAEPDAVLVAESRPGREGVGVATDLAADSAVTLTTDAALAHAVGEWGADAILVGADAVRPDGSVVNKAGTRAAALAGTYEGIEVLAVAASDKVAPRDRTDLEHRDSSEIYHGDADVAVYNPTFDVTPADCVDAVVTEHGALDLDGVAAVVNDHRARENWPEE
jgi:translation initiation factor 2B subunit (eIF-2B alpha/beta/delta family)/ADP-ribose pyrophosphatase YjhB (NUDIX family)